MKSIKSRLLIQSPSGKTKNRICSHDMEKAVHIVSQGLSLYIEVFQAKTGALNNAGFEELRGIINKY